MGVRLCVGLGNPGAKYGMTRHNVGWLAMDALLEKLNKFAGFQYRCNGMIWGPFDVEEERVYLLKPLTFMNLSGRSVVQAKRELNIDNNNILIVYDDIYLPFGKLRLRAKGSAGGHNGMASVIGALGTLEIPRLRIGTGREEPIKDLIGFVLSPFDEEEMKALPDVLERAAKAILAWVTMDIEHAISYVNSSL
ncbi:MAG: aminoacyl-tRNA hydrolase [Acetomicrobium sp.]